MHNPRAGAGHRGAQRIDIRAVPRRQRDQVNAVFIGLTQPHDVVLVVALGLQPDHAIAAWHRLQPERVGIVGRLSREVAHAITDIADFGNAAHDSILQIGWEATANISPVALWLSTGGPLPSWPWQIARLALTI